MDSAFLFHDLNQTLHTSLLAVRVVLSRGKNIFMRASCMFLFINFEIISMSSGLRWRLDGAVCGLGFLFFIEEAKGVTDLLVCFRLSLLRLLADSSATLEPLLSPELEVFKSNWIPITESLMKVDKSHNNWIYISWPKKIYRVSHKKCLLRRSSSTLSNIQTLTPSLI